MEPRIIHSKDPYTMDMVESYDIAALTIKNSNFIEAVLKLDSNYKKESQAVRPDEKFSLRNNASNSKGLYCGSTRFWFEEMTKSNSSYSYDDCVLGAVISIDRSNSTHLETTRNGRIKMAQRIIKCCPNVRSLIRNLSRSFSVKDDSHLISYMIEKGLKSIKNGKDMYYLSFASKFCSYASLFLNVEVDYSKYDDVVARSLPIYYQAYCGKKVKKTEFKVNHSANDKYQDRLDVYERYSAAIKEIIDSLDNDNKLTRDEFDHIIWYGMKGN